MATIADINAIKENIRSILSGANTVGASPVDLSNSLTRRVKNIFKIHPDNILFQSSVFPLVTIYTDSKSITPAGINKDQLSAKKESKIQFSIVGAFWNNNFSSFNEDPADEDIENLMENIELVLRSNSKLNNSVLYSQSTSVTYHNQSMEEDHLRAGILTFEAKLFY